MRSLLATPQQGLSLTEVLAALTVLSIGLLAMISLLPLVASGVHHGAHRSGAIFLASQRLEQVKHAVGLADRDQDPLNAVASLFPDEPVLASPHESFSRSVRVRNCCTASGCAGVQASGVRQVSVTVTYPTAAGQASPAGRGTVLLSTYIGPR
jgi:prepilin-type N-terminal cleavage/methylation domain-containing protein